MKNYIFDTHSHVQFPIYDADREAVINRAKEVGVKMLAVGTQASTSEAGIQLAHQYPEDIWATVGFHPNHATHARTSQTERGLTQTNGHDVRMGAFALPEPKAEARFSHAWYHDKNEQREVVPEEFDIERLRKLAEDPKVVAIGECGLDYYRLTTDNQQLTTVKKLQQEVFLEQVNLAQELKKPLMIHCRPSKGTDDAYYDLLHLLTTDKQQITTVIHFYVGSLEMTKKLVEAGFYFTFGGVITFARNYDEQIKYIPLDRILLETDCPYVAPAPYRGKRNESAYIIETAKKMAEIKNSKLDKVLEETYNNAKTLFNLK